jgi:anti-sigma factor RsiW
VNCEQIEKNIELYLDGELTLSDRRDFEEHITNCTNCSDKLASMRAIQNMIHNTEYSNAPSSLKLNIQNKLRDCTGEENKQSSFLNLLGIGGGSMLAGSFATWAFMSFIFITPMQTQLADEIISSHVNSLMAEHITDIKTDDRHVVKPWFNGRVDFSPPVKDLKKAGFELLGGRLDYMQGKVIAALVNKRRKHIINTFIFKNESSNIETKPQLLQRHGYNLIHWESNGLEYWVISDLNKKELSQFAQLTLKL